MTEYEVTFQAEAKESLKRLDTTVKERIIKEAVKMRTAPPGRHLKHGLDFFVEEVGQYRVVFTCEENRKEIYFVGDHKEYEKWYRKAMQN